MRRRKLDIAGALLLLYVACCHADGWTEKPFLPASEDHENVTWRTCDLAPGCALIYLKENTEGQVELLRLNTDVKPDMILTGSNLIGLEIAEDDKTPKYFLRATQSGNYEAAVNRFTASFSQQNSQFFTTYVILENVNDNPPIISPSKAIGDCRFQEEDVGDTGCTFTVTDDDGSACYAEMTVSDDHFKLVLQGGQTSNCKVANYALEVVTKLDYEKFQLHSLEILAVDRGQVAPNVFLEPEFVFEEKISYVVYVDDIPDEPPVWQQMIPSISIWEKETHTETYSAIDGDHGLQWDIIYFLETDDEYFKIDEKTGVLSISEINRDELKKEIFNLKVTAVEVPQSPWEDHEPESIHVDVVVIVNDKNDNIPSFKPPEDYVDTVDEEQPFSKSIGMVEDPDLGTHGTFDITISENSFSENFIIVPGTGYQNATLILSALNASLMDYEDKDWRIITLEIVAQEHHDVSHRSVMNVIINLRDLNDEVPVFDHETYQVFVEENRPKGTEILTVFADDPDEGDVVKYSMRANAFLEIDELTGKVTTKNDPTFDFEKQSEITLQVRAEDQADPPHSAVSEIFITVLDLNDEAPVIDVGGDIRSVKEHSEKGTNASPDITATDPDTDADLKITIDWDGSVGYKGGLAVDKDKFMTALALADTREETIDGTKQWKTHVIVNDKDKFDWEEFEQVRLRIHVEDRATHENYLDKKDAYSIIFINVDDINDQEPTFTSNSSVVQAVENEEAPRLLGSVLAVDLDGPPHNKVVYSIYPVSPEGLKVVPPQVEIDENTGQISTTNSSFDVEQFRQLEYEYVIYATDGEHTNEHKLIVNILDANDEIPGYKNEIDPDTLTQYFEEHNNVTEELVCLDAEDLDMTDPYNHITYYITGEHEEFFEMVENCFYVTNGKDLDRESGSVRSVTVYMRDNFKEMVKFNSNEGDSIVINVILLDKNDHYPKFEKKDPIPIPEYTQEGVLFTVAVEDPDEGENGTITCNAKPIVTVTYPEGRDMDEVEELFSVSTDNETSTCSVSCLKPLKGFWGRYELFLQAYDHGDPPLPGNETYFLNIESYNLQSPVIQYPEDDDIIRISYTAENGNTRPLLDYNEVPIPDFFATDGDDPETDNGKVEFIPEWDCPGCNGEVYFDFITENLPPNTIRLRKLKDPTENVGYIYGKLTAKDKASDPKSSEVKKFMIVLIDPNSVPQFSISDSIISFSENKTGESEKQSFPAAKNEGQDVLEEQLPVYYHLIEGGDLFMIPICNETVITLRSMLDYEETKSHTIIVGATNIESNCGTNNDVASPGSRLKITVEVIDVNDEPPRFVENPFTGVFRVLDEPGKVVVTLVAIDPDVEDILSYEYVPNSISADESLKDYEKDDSFIVDKTSGEVQLNFAPNGRDLSGSFLFEVVVYDLIGDEDHRDYSRVFVSIVSERHQVSFHFYNTPEEVRNVENEIAAELSEILQYKCSIESIKVATGEGAASGARTDMLTHFINVKEGVGGTPVEGNVITGMFLDGEIYSQLTIAMSNLKLSLSSISKPSDPEEDSMAMTIVLSAVCAVLAVLVIVFLLAFVVRTRTLNQRLEKLTTKNHEFGSQDSGLNREGLAVPGTNVHALEGSNPVWNHEVEQNFDAISQSSGDSELVGIEDSPEFGGSGERGGFGNPAFQQGPGLDDSPPALDHDVGMRRTSINPLAAASAPTEDDPYGFSQPFPGGDMDVPRRFSLNPLATGGDFAMDFGEDADDDEDVEDFAADRGDGRSSNASYESSASEPTTEL